MTPFFLFFDPFNKVSEQDEEIIEHWADGDGDVFLMNVSDLPRFWVDVSSLATAEIKAACSSCEEQTYEGNVSGHSGTILGQLAYAVEGKVSSADGKTWGFLGSYMPQDEKFDFNMDTERSFLQQVATFLGGISTALSQAEEFEVKFTGSPISISTGGSCK